MASLQTATPPLVLVRHTHTSVLNLLPVPANDINKKQQPNSLPGETI